ncbi:hypothetical protein RUE5091_03277 [Ruegeria denitrificans]|uniref:Uncharacterized protein n=1 Tax=Ruegeria denitrificans TaxID=1715692 RepID=A0A0P1IFH0_9RHOB|nr:hypothetical protein RUE5091_03277 [Ruegeria denitrificans]
MPIVLAVPQKGHIEIVVNLRSCFESELQRDHEPRGLRAN